MPFMGIPFNTPTGSVEHPQEELIRLVDVPSLPWLPLRPNGKRGSRPTVYRWAYTGVRGVKLRTLCVGGVRCTTRTWLLQFFEELSGDAAAPTAAPPRRTPTQRDRARERAHREAAEAGI